jgi:hypothetical protein
MKNKVSNEKNSASYLNLIDEFAKSERAITIDDLIFSEDPEIESKILYDFLTKDSRFVKIGTIRIPNNIQFVLKDILFKKIINLNIRLESLRIKYIRYKDFFSIIKPLFSKDLNENDKKVIIKWLKKNPIICNFDDEKILFPHSNTVKTLSKYLNNNLYKLLSEISKKKLHPYQLESIQNKLINKFFNSFFPFDRQREIITLRYGLLDGKIHTLEQIGNLIGVTRERIRQIEKKLMDRVFFYISLSKKPSGKTSLTENIIKPINYLLEYLIITINLHNGSKIIPCKDKILLKLMNFICNLFNIPFEKSDRLNIYLYDCNNKTISDIEKFIITSKTININKIKSFLNNLKGLNITKEDNKNLSKLILNSRKKAFTLLDAVYIALKKIDRPSHYTEIAKECNKLFKEKGYTPRNVMSCLAREPQFSNDKLPWVWTGSRGIYALKEWGYERPELGIYEVVTEIVQKTYHKTKKPVSFIKILSEIGKYRKIINKNSLIIACGCNPKLKLVGKDSYIPIEYSKTKESEEIDFDTDKLNDVLKKFDN